MKTEAALPAIRPIQCAAAVAVLLVSTEFSHAQSQGSRPIEFSQPRDTKGYRTNDQEFGAERRRLTDLEDRLSKTFNFFNSDDSLSGAPAPRQVRRTPVVSKRAKPTSLFEEDDPWISSDPLSRLRELIESDGPTADQLDRAAPMSRGDEESSLLDSLKTDDWLVKGTMSDSFWEMPLFASQGLNDYSPNEEEQSPQDPHQNWSADNDLRPQLEGLMGRDRSLDSPFGNQQAARHSFTGGDVFGLGQPSRSSIEERQAESRPLLGVAAPTDPWQMAAPATSGTAGRPPGQYTPPAVTRNNVLAESRRSLYPTRAANLDSLYPTAPTPPQRPNVLDLIDVEQPGSSATAPDGVLSNPFYQAPQRQF